MGGGGDNVLLYGNSLVLRKNVKSVIYEEIFLPFGCKCKECKDM